MELLSRQSLPIFPIIALQVELFLKSLGQPKLLPIRCKQLHHRTGPFWCAYYVALWLYWMTPESVRST
jgi:hypothetical protein